MSASIYSGKEISRVLRATVATGVQRFSELHGPLVLRVVRVGDDEAAAGYARGVLRACGRVGVNADLDILSSDTSTYAVQAHVHSLNADPNVHGIVLAVPLTDGVDEGAVLEAIRPSKDVDRVTAVALGELFAGRTGIGPATAAAVIEMLDFYSEPIEGQRVTVIGRSNVVGKPVGAMLLARHATVTICHSRTVDLANVTAQAEILVAAVGHAGFIGPEHVGEGAVVIDVGMNYVEGGLVGDVDFDAVVPCVRAITPVPGGIGPLTNYCLVRNLVELNSRQVGLAGRERA